MATPALDRAVLVRLGTSRDLDDVMEVMDAAFGDRFGEAWTRSQCAGILPMAGVSLMVARDVDSGAAIGFSLSGQSPRKPSCFCSRSFHTIIVRATGGSCSMTSCSALATLE